MTDLGTASGPSVASPRLSLYCSPRTLKLPKPVATE